MATSARTLLKLRTPMNTEPHVEAFFKTLLYRKKGLKMTGKFDRNVENEILSKWVLAPSKFFDPYFQAIHCINWATLVTLLPSG